MKKMLLNFADKLLSAEQRKAVKGGYQGWNPSSSTGIPGTPGPGGTMCVGVGFATSGAILWIHGGQSCPPGMYNGH